jgi:hypothetical protein
MARNERPHYNDEICDLDHGGDVPKEVIETLPFKEAHPFRHRCAGCAYAAGLSEGAKDIGALATQVRELTEERDKLRAELDALKAKR